MIQPKPRSSPTFGPLSRRWVHLCVDMQRLFAEATHDALPALYRKRVSEQVEIVTTEAILSAREVHQPTGRAGRQRHPQYSGSHSEERAGI